MERTGQIDLPLHSGKAPRWLFERMVRLARCISEAMLIEFGREYFLRQLSDPFWFQSLGCILGFDWHSSGLTTTVCGALKEAFYDLPGCGVYICGGKGRVSRKTPYEIEEIAQKQAHDPKELIYASHITAKVDNNALQDGFTLYHHTFIFTQDYQWAVIQQGMSDSQGGCPTSPRLRRATLRSFSTGGWARRYHWHSGFISSFVNEPHSGIASEASFLTLNLVSKEGGDLRSTIAELAGRSIDKNLRDFNVLRDNQQSLPRRHKVLLRDINPKYLNKIFLKTYIRKPQDFEKLLSLEGVGAKTLRALALIGDLIYGKPISFRDPARFSFAHGGKDGYPYKIKCEDYDKTVTILERAIQKAKLERSERLKALHRLYSFYNLKEAS